jgi:hypothetical protein
MSAVKQTMSGLLSSMVFACPIRSETIPSSDSGHSKNLRPASGAKITVYIGRTFAGE